MPVRRRRTTKRRTVRRTKRRTTLKRKVRRKKGATRRAVAKKMMITPAQRQKLRRAMNELARNINVLTTKYNKLWAHLSKF
jgi:hypothetical protein